VGVRNAEKHGGLMILILEWLTVHQPEPRGADALRVFVLVLRYGVALRIDWLTGWNRGDARRGVGNGGNSLFPCHFLAPPHAIAVRLTSQLNPASMLFEHSLHTAVCL